MTEYNYCLASWRDDPAGMIERWMINTEWVLSLWPTGIQDVIIYAVVQR